MAKKIYQLKISLRGVKPAVWRRILVEDTMTFLKLQKVIHTAFGWPLSKYSAFKVRGISVCQRYSLVDIHKECLDSVTTRLFVFNLEPGEKIEMRQDLVDKWMFDIEVEAYVAPDMQNAYPICVDIQGITPPKDLGSARDFAIYQKAIMDKNHKAHQFYKHQYALHERNFDSSIVNINRKMTCV